MIYLQYEQPNITAYVDSLQTNISVSAAKFNNEFFNILTCNAAGLDNWGIILNQPRSVLVPNWLAKNKIGFDTGTPPASTGDYPQNFNNSNFAQFAATTSILLSDDQYRALLQFTYLNYVTNATLKTINKNMNFYYNPGNNNGRQVAVTNSGNMQITYTFNFALQPYEIILFNQPTNVLPTPIGVKQILAYPGA